MLETGSTEAFFRTIPSAIGNVYQWKKWAFGFNIVVPDYEFFSGNIANTVESQSFLTYTDESLWSGCGCLLQIQ